MPTSVRRRSYVRPSRRMATSRALRQRTLRESKQTLPGFSSRVLLHTDSHLRDEVPIFYFCVGTTDELACFQTTDLQGTMRIWTGRRPSLASTSL